MKIETVEKSYGRTALLIKDAEAKDINQRDLTGDGPYNRSGKPYFNINIEDKQAMALFNDGWRIKKRGKDMTQLNKKGEPGKWVNSSDMNADLENYNYILEARIDYTRSRPTRVFRVIPGKEIRELFYNSRSKDTNIAILKEDVILKWNCRINAFKNPDDGIISGYLDEIYFEVQPNELAELYSDLPTYQGLDGLEDE